ncbi:MAG: NmrA/HSCARG family protein [Gemmatimonadetes bacterium]|nr:NmrA/HSCARG family protein [Gemmatimonadota bacterium]
MNSDKLIAVAGATGQQGGATTRHLLERGFQVRALTRDPSSESAKKLQAAGAETVAVDLANPATLGPALAGVYGVFSVQNFWLPGVGYEGEIVQGKNLADAAKAASVKHFVYSSVGGAEREAAVPHFDSKWIIEQHIASLGLPATILAPVAFMENNLYQRDAILGGTFPTGGIAPGKTLQIVAVDDIGAFAAIALERPDEFIGQAIELAGDDLTEEQMAEAFTRVTGRTVTLDRTPPEGAPALDAEMVAMIKWFNEHGYEADIPALRRIHPGLKTLETWAREAGFDAAVATA